MTQEQCERAVKALQEEGFQAPRANGRLVGQRSLQIPLSRSDIVQKGRDQEVDSSQK